jgi:hypothetical protein
VREDKTFSNKYIDRVRGKSNSWWLIAGAVEDSKNSGLVSIEFNKKYQDYWNGQVIVAFRYNGCSITLQ